MRDFPPIHGEILQEEFLEPMGICFGLEALLICPLNGLHLPSFSLQ